MAYAKKNSDGSDEAVLELAMDRLAVELGLEIVKLVPGYVSTEVDIRASFDTAESVRRARRLIAMYEAAGVPRTRVLIKLAGTWEGIAAARVLEKEGITCNITLIFGFIQAVAAAQAGARLISPFPGRIKDWAAANGGAPAYEPSEDPGVVCVARECGFSPPGPLAPSTMKGCSARSGGRDRCCAGFIQRFGEPCCRTFDLGCVVSAPLAGRTHR